MSMAVTRPVHDRDSGNKDSAARTMRATPKPERLASEDCSGRGLVDAARS